MKNLKTTILSAFIAICCLTNGNAQENKLKASDGKKAVSYTHLDVYKRQA